MENGTRVKVVRGRKAQGLVGTVFWIGDDRYRKGGKRLGIHGDDGETHWVSADHVEETDEPAPAPGPVPGVGDRIAFFLGEDEVEGTVAWIGPSQHGPGFRVGVQDASGETHFIDGHRIRVL